MRDSQHRRIDAGYLDRAVTDVHACRGREYEAARRLNEDTLARRRRVLGEEHPDTLASASRLAANLRALGPHEAAHQLGEDTETRRRAAGN